jgi:NADH-quinone oxidoreductase subunit M
MILIWLIIIPVAAAIIAWMSESRGPQWPRWISLAALTAQLAVVLVLWVDSLRVAGSPSKNVWLAAIDLEWIPQLGIGFRLAMDGLSLLMVMLTAFLGIASVICSWTEIQSRVGFFHFNLMACLGGITGVFLATDLVLFYMFWEVMLVPMYFLIGIWGHENRIYAAIKFFIFTQAGGLFMLVSILGLYFVHGQQTGSYTFNYFELLGMSLTGWGSLGLMLGFFVAFAVKLPMVPLHTWLADAHTEAPTAGSVILAGLLLKTGGYGFIRFILPVFPDAAEAVAPFIMVLAVIGIIYAAMLALAQSDLKRLIAYTSISHLGFVLLGVFARNELALQGAVMQMIAHGISTGMLFILAGLIQERIGTRDMDRMGGFWSSVPRMGGVAMVFALASLGLPGLGNFVGEFLVLVGTYQSHPWMAAPAAIGLVLAAAYSLRLMARIFFGPNEQVTEIRDLTARETLLAGAMTVTIVWLGIFPQTVLATSRNALLAVIGTKGMMHATYSANSEAAASQLHAAQGVQGLSLPGGNQ